MKKKKWSKVIAALVVAAAMAAFAAPKLFSEPQNAAQSANTIRHTVSRGDIAATVTGSGRLETEDNVTVEIPVGIEIAGVFAEAGDLVAEGDLIASVDEDSVSDRAAELSAELSALDMQLMMRKTAGEIKVPVKGRIKQISAAEDEDVIEIINRCGSLAVLSTDGLMQIEFETEDVLSMNAEVDVKWNSGSEEGTIAGRTERGYVVTFSDEKAPYLAQADVYFNVEKIGSGIVDIHAPLTIYGNGGTISEIHKEVDDVISAGAKLFTLSNEPAVDSYRKTMADRSEKARQFQSVLELLDSPYLCAPCSGVVRSVYISEGEKTASAAMQAKTDAFELGVGGAVCMTIDIDELDIGKIALGQSASVTLDAFGAQSFDAVVEKISYLGKSTGSITTYAVQLKLEPDDRLLSGMNGSAVILSESAQDVLWVPLAAVMEDGQGEYVSVEKEDGTTEKVYIETGLSDGTNAQILSGLSEGDVLVYRGSMNALMLMQQKMMENQAAMFGGMNE